MGFFYLMPIIRNIDAISFSKYNLMGMSLINAHAFNINFICDHYLTYYSANIVHKCYIFTIKMVIISIMQE